MPRGSPPGIVGSTIRPKENIMIRNRFRTRFISLLAILTTAMTAMLVGATAASAQVAPEPGGTSDIVYVPLSPVTQVVHDSQGLHWWAIVLIAAAAALIAAALTELYDTARHRHDNMSLSPA